MQNALRLRAVKIIKILQKVTQKWEQPLVNQIIQEYGQDPFLILIACLLSLRSRDKVTLPVCRVLFSKAKTPQEILDIPISKLEKIIFSINYYKTKARVLHSVSKAILIEYHGKVPNTAEQLLAIKGVGPKTANLVLGMGFNIPKICVDVHVHRISNLLGLIHTKTPEETEIALENILPKKYWIEWNRLLVMLGQNVPASKIQKFINKKGT